MTRSLLPLAFALAGVLALAPVVHAQIHPGLHVARAADSFGGVNGVGGSLRVSLPALPVDLFFAGEYFLPDCDGCSFWGGYADVHVSLPVPTVMPHGTDGRRFVDGPVLTMPAAGSGTFDTWGSVGIPGVGTVLFKDFTLSARRGRLEADGGVLRAADGTTLSVPVTVPLEGTTLRGDGWTATLNTGWAVRPAARPGSFVIVRQEPGRR